jgi:hypothetical protein
VENKVKLHSFTLEVWQDETGAADVSVQIQGEKTVLVAALAAMIQKDDKVLHLFSKAAAVAAIDLVKVYDKKPEKKKEESEKG